MNDTCFEILPAVNCSREENFIGWEVYLSWNMWEFYESGRLLQCYGSSNFLTFRSILQSNKAERYIPENKSMRCDKLDEKSLLFSPWAPICFVTNKDFLNQSKKETFSCSFILINTTIHKLVRKFTTEGHQIKYWFYKFIMNDKIDFHYCVLRFNQSPIGPFGALQWPQSHPDFDICLAHVLFSLSSIRLT